MTVDCLPQLCVTAHLRRILLFSRFQVPLQFFRRPWLHILVNVAGCLIRGRRRWSVTNTPPRGPRISEFFRIWNRRAFQEIKPYQFPGWMKNSPYYCAGRCANPRPPAHPDFITSKVSHTLRVRP